MTVKPFSVLTMPMAYYKTTLSTTAHSFKLTTPRFGRTLSLTKPACLRTFLLIRLRGSWENWTPPFWLLLERKELLLPICSHQIPSSAYISCTNCPVFFFSSSMGWKERAWQDVRTTSQIRSEEMLGSAGEAIVSDVMNRVKGLELRNYQTSSSSSSSGKIRCELQISKPTPKIGLGVWPRLCDWFWTSVGFRSQGREVPGTPYSVPYPAKLPDGPSFAPERERLLTEQGRLGWEARRHRGRRGPPKLWGRY